MDHLKDVAENVSMGKLQVEVKRFIARQCKSHLKIETSALSGSHVKDLAMWMGVGAGLIMDAAKAGELSNKIAALA